MTTKTFQEKMDELLLTTLREMSRELEAYGYLDSKNYLPEKREAITSLIKELVAEAKPAKEIGAPVGKYETGGECSAYADGSNEAAEQFEQNLLKALEEV